LAFSEQFAAKGAALVLVVAAVECARRGWAALEYDRLSQEPIARAARLDPGNAAYRVALGRLADDAGSDPRPYFQEALHRNTRDARTWIRLGLAEEERGRIGEAETALRAAAGHSRLHEPAWTLANFYYRRRDRVRFAHWARRTLAITYQYEAPPFDQAWDLLGTGAAVEGLLPARDGIRLTYGHYLASRQRWDELEGLLATVRPDKGIVTALAGAYRVRAAAAAGIVAGTPLDWKPLARGVTPLSDGWRIEGAEPGPLLERISPVLRGRPYLLKAFALGDATGLRWTITAHTPEGTPVATGPAGPPLHFVAPGAEGVRIRLERITRGGDLNLIEPRLEEVR
jgi:hypothetical protein